MGNYPAVETLGFTSEALVETERPERYAKQLVSHLGRKVPSVEIENGHRLTFNRDDIFRGYGDVLVMDGKLVLRAYAANTEDLQVLNGVLGRHLERFGERDGLTVNFI